LSGAFGKPITSTSVNRTGEDAMNDPEKIADEFGSELDILIDGGTLPKSPGSTIYLLKGNTIKILRK
jgi:tRNA A37 threonylcarbamoyladenosine synthetase subunit TsaC/SUA5/YrdC